MPFSLLDDTFTLTLHYIGSILDSLKELVPKYSLGLKVMTIETNEMFTWVITGRICGFEYFSHPNYDSGWFYFIAIETSQLCLNDGTTKFCTQNELEFVPEHEVQLVD